ncbi:hypothetical protein BFW01_g10547 [Lasiodiplodia theobromae]|uniref:Uncharacterized protein n=1 Tax=Lasiodiplodia theobromae TaxID=45133 RepID=A0A8H7IPP5_9PEZI|nr:hypothetical protein BFW01_g10547 [Lasiodiplodia theobromae]
MTSMYDAMPGPPPPPPMPGAGPGPGGPPRPPVPGGGGAAAMPGGRPGGGPGGMPPGGPGGLGPGGPGGRPNANIHRPLDHQLGNATGPVTRSFHGWSFRKDREPGVEPSWARARKTPLPYSADELLRIVNRTTTTSPTSSSNKKGNGKGTVSEQYNSLRSSHQRALVDGLLEAVKAEERNQNAEWTLACIEQDIAEYIRRDRGKIREVREMRVVLRRGPRRDAPGASAPIGDGLPGVIIDLLNGQGQGPHQGTQPLHQQPFGAAPGGGLGLGGAPPGGAPRPAMNPGGPPAAGGPMGGPFGGPPGGPVGAPGGGPGSRPVGGPSGGPVGGPSGGPIGGPAGGPTGGPTVLPPPPIAPSFGAQKGGAGGGAGAGAHGPAGRGSVGPPPVASGGQKAGKGPSPPMIIPESEFSDELDDDDDSILGSSFGRPHKPTVKGKKSGDMPRVSMPFGRGQSRERERKSPKIREAEPHQNPTIIINNKIPREKNRDRHHRAHNRPKHERYYGSSSEENYGFTPGSSEDDNDDWSIGPSSMSSGSPPRHHHRSYSRERYDYPTVGMTREHKKPSPQHRPILRGYQRQPGGYPVDAEGYYENGGYDAMEQRRFDPGEDYRRYRAPHPALTDRGHRAYSPPNQYHERPRSGGRMRLPPAPEVNAYEAPWRRADAMRRLEEEELLEREAAAQADLDLYMRKQRVRTLEAAADETRGRRYGRRDDWW